MTTTRDEGWSGEMLDRPEMVAAFASQLRHHLAEYADYVSRIRRDAEAMWAENPPPEYGSFEAWWRHGRVTAPLAEIQEHLEKAMKLTHRLEARYRKHRHEIPAARQAAAQAKQAPALARGTDAGRVAQRRPAEARAPATSQDGSFLDMIRRESA
ncbi:hypothetical protein [Nonomuraea rhodomycinica]|uniref:Uncharacterized protein n=1 Tax=Nonomuraea rhodomycinica TaxID=1712872 RepID=A0A7Y6MF12_9ACTN|nr:hypothetical protein [Nonomuraea rhodomycinica]NUW45512.1 hypothetical protein [Nonomuraea rhodomycinica]